MSLRESREGRTLHPLLVKLVAAEALYGELGVAERLDIKLRMWRYVKAATHRLSPRSLRAAGASFPALREDIRDYAAAGVLETV